MPLPPPVPRRQRLQQLALLCACCLVAGVASIAAGQDASWDLRNYHLYNPWAWRTGRYGFDLAPAQLQTFHNPLGDLPLEAMIRASFPPRLIAFVLALPAGVGAYFVVRIATVLLRELDQPLRWVAQVAAVVVGVTGVNSVATLGTTMSEWPGTALLLASFWLIVRDLSHGQVRGTTLFLAGLGAGIACGLKLTSATFALALAIALVVRGSWREGVCDAALFSAAVCAGLVASAGWWMVLLADLYQSPLFPYFNQWFRSPLVPPEPWIDARFGPRTLVGWLRLPFDLWRPPAGLVSELPHRDARLMLVGVLGPAALAAWSFRSSRNARTAVSLAGGGRWANTGLPSDPAWRYLAVFFAASLVVWALLHTIYRYLMPLEALSGVALAGAVVLLVPGRWRLVTLIALSVFVVWKTRYPDWGRIPFGDRFVMVERPPIEPGALIVITTGSPVAWVLPHFPADARHLGIENNLIRMHKPTQLQVQARAIVAAHTGPIYQLTAADSPADEVLADYGLSQSGSACAEVRGNLERVPLKLCRLRRRTVGDPAG